MRDERDEAPERGGPAADPPPRDAANAPEPPAPGASAPDARVSSDTTTPETREPVPATADTGAAGAPEPAPAPAPRVATSEREPAPAPAPPRVSAPGGWRLGVAEPPESVITRPRARLAAQSRRDFLMLAAGTLAAATAAWWLLPDRAKSRLLPGAAHDRLDTLAARVGLTRERREATLDRGLTFDDDVAEALYSKDRRVRTYQRSDVTPLRNNYHGRTPGPEFLPGWALEVSGLAAGRPERLTLAQLLARFPLHGQVTRLVCVEGWSAVAWWGGIRFADFLAAFPPAPGARWAALTSRASLDSAGRTEPYYVSIDLDTARHPQTLLATHFDGRPLPLAHGAPLRLVAPMKLGLKNIKAITDISYSTGEPPDYWNERGYSKYDGL